MGFRAIDYITQELKASLPKEKFNGLIFTAKVKDKKVLIVKPQTFMNNSGQCLFEIMQFYKLAPESFIVIYDDIDLPEGKLRLRARGGPGTHNGMRSIVSELKSENFARIRIGMGQPENAQMDLADYVLAKPTGESVEKVNKAILRAGDAAIMAVSEGFDEAMQKYNSMG